MYSDKKDIVGIFIHIFYTDIIGELKALLARFPYSAALYISTDDAEKKSRIEEAFESARDLDSLAIRVFPNHGRDIAPLVVGFRDEILRHDICLKLHTKKSTHYPPDWGESWRRHLFTELAGSRERIEFAVEKFRRHRKLGMLVAAHWPRIAHWIKIGDNYNGMKALMDRIGFELDAEQHIEFPAGSMFWFRGAALKSLLDLNLSIADFADSDALDRDSTIAHAIERSFLFFVAAAGYGWGTLPATSPIHLDQAEAYGILLESGLFDSRYYRSENREALADEQDPFEHFFYRGWREDRNPSSWFDVRFYRDVAGPLPPDMNPLLHFLVRGRQLGIPASPWLRSFELSKADYENRSQHFHRLAELANELP